MLNLNVPAQSLFTAPESYKGSFYPVVSQSELTLVLQDNADDPLKVGDYLEFVEGIRGYVLEELPAQQQAVAALLEPALVSRAYRAPLVNLSLSTVKDFWEPSSHGPLFVKCQNTGTARPGLLGWSLFDANEDLIAIGSDYESKDICYLEGSGVWPEGDYLLKVSSFISPAQKLFGTSKRWNLSQPAPLLAVGDYSTSAPALTLR